MRLSHLGRLSYMTALLKWTILKTQQLERGITMKGIFKWVVLSGVCTLVACGGESSAPAATDTAAPAEQAAEAGSVVDQATEQLQDAAAEAQAEVEAAAEEAQAAAEEAVEDAEAAVEDAKASAADEVEGATADAADAVNDAAADLLK